MLDVIIAGAGIGGLVTALTLHKAGLSVRVFESVAEIKPLGVGINLLPHSVRHLYEIGLRAKLDAIGVRTSELRYYSKHGQKIWAEPRGLGAGYRWPQYSIHRGHLQRLLYDEVCTRLGKDAVRLGQAVVEVRQDGESIAPLLAARDVAEQRVGPPARLLIAADGIHSSLRASRYPDEGAPIWNGAILWRGTTRARPYLDQRTMCMSGHQDQKFVCYPISAPDAEGMQVINWIAERRFERDRGWRREDWNRAGKLDEFLPSFRTWRFDWLDVPALIEQADAVYEYPMVDRDPLPQWTFGRFSMLGDAAHPMYPIGSNGASQAILDARALARVLRERGVGPAALMEYEALRRPPTSGIVLANRKNGPEQVMQLVEERAPQGFADLEAVISRAELTEIAETYKRLAGFDPARLNAEPDLFAGGA